MAIFSWHDGPVPMGLPIRQIYGLIFSHDGRLLLCKDGNEYSLAGGRPEAHDHGMEGTLRRELIEEVNILIHKPYIVGYQLVDEENRTEPFAQARMTALLTQTGSLRPDPATGRTDGRLLVPPARAAELLRWGDVGVFQIRSAVEIAKNHFLSSWLSTDETFV